MKVLIGHDSPETAHVVEDYPYGFRLRCKIRYWIETKKKHGQRFVYQTTNPKIEGREVWNAPKASTYALVAVMFEGPLEIDGKKIERAVQWSGNPNPYDGAAKIDAWIAQFGPEAFADDYRRKTVDALRRFAAAYEAHQAKKAEEQTKEIL